MELKKNRLKSIVMILALGVFLTGCATSPKNKAIDKEKLLVSAGFQKMLGDTQEKLDHLKEMPQRKIFKKEKDGTLYYVWADEKSCKCLYYGEKEAYESYQQILLEMKIEKDAAASAAMYRSGVSSWGMWGTWRGPRRY